MLKYTHGLSVQLTMTSLANMLTIGSDFNQSYSAQNGYHEQYAFCHGIFQTLECVIIC